MRGGRMRPTKAEIAWSDINYRCWEWWNKRKMRMLKTYRLMNLGIGDENKGKFGVLGQPFAICDECLPFYSKEITNNEDSRLVQDFGYTDGPCSYYGHKDK